MSLACMSSLAMFHVSPPERATIDARLTSTRAHSARSFKTALDFGHLRTAGRASQIFLSDYPDRLTCVFGRLPRGFPDASFLRVRGGQGLTFHGDHPVFTRISRRVYRLQPDAQYTGRNFQIWDPSVIVAVNQRSLNDEMDLRRAVCAVSAHLTYDIRADLRQTVIHFFCWALNVL